MLAIDKRIQRSNPHQGQADRDSPPTRPHLTRRGLARPRAASATACGDTTSQGSTARLDPRARDRTADVVPGCRTSARLPTCSLSRHEVESAALSASSAHCTISPLRCAYPYQTIGSISSSSARPARTDMLQLSTRPHHADSLTNGSLTTPPARYALPSPLRCPS